MRATVAKTRAVCDARIGAPCSHIGVPRSKSVDALRTHSVHHHVLETLSLALSVSLARLPGRLFGLGAILMFQWAALGGIWVSARRC